MPILGYTRDHEWVKVEDGDDYEIVLVNDGSRDGSWAIMQQLAAADSRVVAVNLSRNHGHQLALTAGLDLCRGDVVLIIDADLRRAVQEESFGVQYQPIISLADGRMIGFDEREYDELPSSECVARMRELYER